MKGKHTEVCNCTVLQLAAIDYILKTNRQYQLLAGRIPWTRKDRTLLDRLRNVRGLNVIEDHGGDHLVVTISGTLLPGGFTKVIADCQKVAPTRV